MLNKDNLPIVSLLPPSVSVSVSGSVGLTSQLTKLDIGSDPYCQDGRVVVNRTLLVPTPFDPPHLVMDNQIAPSTLLESWVRVLVGRHLKMPIPARTSAAGTAPYPWRIELHAVNLLRPTSDPWNHRYGSFKVGCRTGQENKGRQEARACDSRAAGNTSYDSQQRGLGCVRRSCFAICPESRDKAESPSLPWLLKKLLRTLIAQASCAATDVQMASVQIGQSCPAVLEIAGGRVFTVPSLSSMPPVLLDVCLRHAYIGARLLRADHCSE